MDGWMANIVAENGNCSRPLATIVASVDETWGVIWMLLGIVSIIRPNYEMNLKAECRICVTNVSFTYVRLIPCAILEQNC